MRARSVGIWISGLIACGFIGGGIGDVLDPSTGAFTGIIGGMAAFTCARLWFGDRPPMDLPIKRFGAEQ